MPSNNQLFQIDHFIKIYLAVSHCVWISISSIHKAVLEKLVEFLKKLF